MSQDHHAHENADAPLYYGGQAVLEGVMMRGKARWAVAVRQPDGSIWVEAHPTSTTPQRKTWLSWPMIRGCFALYDSLKIGMRALSISADRSFVEEDTGASDSAAAGASLALALVVFVGIFIFLPSSATKGIDALIGNVMGDGVWFHLIESVIRVAIFLAYLLLISRISDIRRVFEYHGAEHQTIAAFEHDEELTPEALQRYPTAHVRCGTNFLILVMLLAVVVYTAGGLLVPPSPDLHWTAAVGYHVALRIVLLPVVAGLAYELLRIGARFGDNLLVRAVMAPGIWLQHITTKTPDVDQMEVAIRAFEAAQDDMAAPLTVADSFTSRLAVANDSLSINTTAATVEREPEA